MIYGLHSITVINEQGLKTFDKRTLFYSPDLGETTELVEELKDFSVSRFQIFSHSVFVTTPDSTRKIWISTGGPFQEALLPVE